MLEFVDVYPTDVEQGSKSAEDCECENHLLSFYQVGYPKGECYKEEQGGLDEQSVAANAKAAVRVCKEHCRSVCEVYRT